MSRGARGWHTACNAVAMKYSRSQPIANVWWRTWGAALIAALAAVAAVIPAHAAPAPTSCLAETARAETERRIPPQLLSAIALAESGRWDSARKEIIAWPWTIYAEGRAHYLPTKARAVAKVKHLRAHGVSNIDVGCMQVNLHYHPNAFATIEEAFDPTTNVAYAADLLLRLKNETRSWSRSIGYYHSRRIKHGGPYRRRVQRLWITERRRSALEGVAERRQAAVERRQAAMERRAERAAYYRKRKATIAAVQRRLL